MCSLIAAGKSEYRGAHEAESSMNFSRASTSGFVHVNPRDALRATIAALQRGRRKAGAAITKYFAPASPAQKISIHPHHLPTSPHQRGTPTYNPFCQPLSIEICKDVAVDPQRRRYVNMRMVVDTQARDLSGIISWPTYKKLYEAGVAMSLQRRRVKIQLLGHKTDNADGFVQLSFRIDDDQRMHTAEFLVLPSDYPKLTWDMMLGHDWILLPMNCALLSQKMIRSELCSKRSMGDCTDSVEEGKVPEALPSFTEAITQELSRPGPHHVQTAREVIGSPPLSQPMRAMLVRVLDEDNARAQSGTIEDDDQWVQ